MTTTDAQALRAAFSAADEGNPVPLVDLYADDMVWAGFSLDGTQKLYTKVEFLNAFGILAKLDESKNEILKIEDVGEGVVTANVRAYRRLGAEVLDFTMVMTHRFLDGKVTHGADMCPASFERFWHKTGLTV